MSITNKNGTQVKTNTIIVFDSEGAVPVEMMPRSARAGISWGFSGGGKIAVNATAAYNQYAKNYPLTEYFSQPIGYSFSYTKLDSNAQVQNISLRYFCSGEVHTLPSLTNQYYDDYYEGKITQSSPLSNTSYGRTQPYNSSYAMWVSGPIAKSPGQYLTCEATINGTTYTGSSGLQRY